MHNFPNSTSCGSQFTCVGVQSIQRIRRTGNTKHERNLLPILELDDEFYQIENVERRAVAFHDSCKHRRLSKTRRAWTARKITRVNQESFRNREWTPALFMYLSLLYVYRWFRPSWAVFQASSRIPSNSVSVKRTILVSRIFIHSISHSPVKYYY